MNIFLLKEYYVGVGICVKDNNYCCVYIGPEPILNDVIYVQNNYKYVVHTKFRLKAIKKVIYPIIISNLYRCEIYPKGDINLFNHPINPNNKFYMDLKVSDLTKIIHIIRRSITSMTLEKTNNGVLTTIYDEITNDNRRINELMIKELPRITLDFTGILLLTPAAPPKKIDFNNLSVIR